MGELKKLSKPEIFAVYTYAAPQVIMPVDMSVPSDEEEIFKLVSAMLQKSFQAGWVE